MFAVIDGHVDLVYHLRNHAPGLPFSSLLSGPLSPRGLRQGGVRIFAAALFSPDRYNGPGTSGTMLQELINYSFQYLDTISLIKERSALKQFYTQVSDDPGYILLLENADVLADWPCQNLWDTGIFCVGLTHIGHNRLADGNGVDWPQGLSKTGEIVVKALDHEKMILDLAHLAEPGFWEVMDLFSGPMMTSHTGFRKFFDVPRNLSEQQLAEIIIRDGMVGLTINPEMFGQPQIKVEDLFRHVDWFVQKFGCDHIGIGTDLGGFELTGEECSEYTCLQELAAYCEKAGYSQAEIQQILGGNWYSFLGKYLP